jgi:hypothetical protein
MCIDYRALNKITVRECFPLPRIDTLLDGFAPFTLFSSLDSQSGYNQTRIDDADVEKTAFITSFGQYQIRVLSFGLSNAPATFQRLVNKLFAPYIGKFVQVYLDNIIIMSRSPEEHLTHLRLVSELLEKHKLYAKLSKCEFGKTSIKFLGHIVGAGTVPVDPDKTAVVRNCPAILLSCVHFSG